MAANEEDLVALQLEVAIEGAGQQLHGDDQDAEGIRVRETAGCSSISMTCQYLRKLQALSRSELRVIDMRGLKARGRRMHAVFLEVKESALLTYARSSTIATSPGMLRVCWSWADSLATFDKGL